MLNGHIGPNPSREVTGALLGSLRNGRLGPNPGREITGHGRSREVMGGYGRLREVTGGYGGGKRRKGGKWRNGRKNVGKKREKMKENREKQGENGGTWRNSEAQRRAASVGARNKIVCRGMRSDTEEGGAKGCKARRSLPNVLQMVWASKLVRTGL